jgi:UMF1 family MFS transporter
MLSVLIWIGICVAAYYVKGVNGFYLLASVVGLVMGGIQSLSRSTFAKLIPNSANEHASYFSFYEFTEKVAIVIGTFFFGFIEQFVQWAFNVNSMRYSVLALMIFFIIGLYFLIVIRNEKIEV